LLHNFNSEKGEPKAMDQTQAKRQSAQPTPRDWTRSEWFGLVGGFKSVPAEEPVAESPAKISGTVSFKIDNPEIEQPELTD